MTTQNKVFLIDGSGYIFRAYYGIRPLSTSTGVPTNAVIGFARMLGKLLRNENPSHIAIAFDAKEKTFRHQIYDLYKANRDAPPEDLVPQFDLIQRLVQAMGITMVKIPGYEADDIIATMAKDATNQGFHSVVVSADKDLMQMLSPNVSIIDPMKDIHVDLDRVKDKFGVAPEYVIDVLALAGDSSDNVPGVYKVGVKTAAKLVNEFGHLDDIIAGLKTRDKLKAAERNILNEEDMARLSLRLVTLHEEVPVDVKPAELAYSSPNLETLEPFLEEIEARNLLRDLKNTHTATTNTEATAVTTESETPAASTEQSPDAVEKQRDYLTVFELEELKEFLQARPNDATLVFDLETTSLNAHLAEIVGFALSYSGSAAIYVPVAHRYLGVPKQLSLDSVLSILGPILSSKDIPKAGQNIKYDMNVLAKYQIFVEGVRDDSMLQAYVLDASRGSFSMDSLSKELLQHEPVSYKSLTGTGKSQIGFDEVPIDAAANYAAEDADITERLCDLQKPKLEKSGVEHIYKDLELPLLSVLSRMECRGIKVDTDALQDMSKEFQQKLNTIESKCEEIIGSRINLNSPKQLAKVFFEDLKYPVIKKTKTGYSTDHEVLETLAQDYELPKVILEFRMLSKLKSTYVDALPKLVNQRTGRVHTTFNQTGTATGRLSSTEPNLQNIPIRGEEGRRIRRAFIPEDGSILIAADYSQVELRVMAHLCGDPSFIEAFQNGEDIHSRTAREILTDGNEPSSDDRRKAKAINFGILYGLSEFGLAKQLDIKRSEAREFITKYFARYPGIRTYLDQTIETGRDLGYVSTLLGRRRFLPDLKSRNGSIRQAAERIAMNTPIQGSAADIIKLAMLRVDAAITKRGLESRLLLQVHDELVVEAKESEIDEVESLLKTEMSQAMKLDVPLDVDVGRGENWAEAH